MLSSAETILQKAVSSGLSEQALRTHAENFQEKHAYFALLQALLKAELNNTLIMETLNNTNVINTHLTCTLELFSLARFNFNRENIPTFITLAKVFIHPLCA